MAKSVEASEADVIRHVTQWCKSVGLRYQRMAFLPGVATSYPDIEFHVPGGRPTLIEFKRPGEKPRPAQLHRLAVLRDDGYDAVWYDNSKDAIEHLHRRMLDALHDTD